MLKVFFSSSSSYAVSDLLTDLGSNMSINCDLDENEVYWILLKTADPPTVILLSTTTSPFYFNNTFRKKYSVQFKHRLVINNVTADELGVYYCMNTRTPPKLSNSTRIYFSGDTRIYFNGEFIYYLISVIICFSLFVIYYFFIHAIIVLPHCVISVSLQVTGDIGGSVLLPCSSTEPDLKPQDINVHWRHNGSKIVYDIVKAHYSLELQDQQYKNRVESFPDQYLKGNVSIKLNNLQHTDAGTYSCIITPSSDLHTVQIEISYKP
uniref:Ig-like domain-containing protein n=1 Tax=Cyprinus carpio TaxID=7962 RepID=A0A8C1IZR5_CYPCA